MSADDDKAPEARPTSATVHLRSHPPRGPFGTARAILTQLGARVVRRLTEGSPPNLRREPEPRRTTDLPVFWLEPAESDVELLNAGLRELEAQSAAALDKAAPGADEPEEMAGASWWPPLRDRLTEQITKTGAFAEPVFKAPSPPAPPTLVAQPLDGAVIPPGWDDAQKPAPKAKKPPKAGSVAASSTSPEERHTRAVLTLVGQDGGGAENKPPPDPIDELSEAECREALKAVREAVYGVAVDDVRLSVWGETTTAQTTAWLLDAPLFVQRSMDVHDALGQFGLDVHEENEPLVEYAAAAGVLLVKAADLDWTNVPGAAAADRGGEE